MFLVSARYLVPKGYDGITVYPFIFLRHAALRNHQVFINHEKIHLRQQLELLVIPFFLIYGIEFLLGLLKYKNWKSAYLNISFEREAYANEKSPDFLSSRPFWNFTRFF